jgi:hypothetical protein
MAAAQQPSRQQWPEHRGLLVHTCDALVFATGTMECLPTITMRSHPPPEDQRRQIMTDSTNLSEGQTAQPHADLTTLDRLVGTWAVSGEAEGTVVYEWTEGGFFLLQHVDLGGNKGLEVIGHEHRYGEDPSADIRSRYFGFSEGETLDYTYEIKDDKLTIWMGQRNSPAYYEGKFSEDGNTLTGAWHYPGGGGYSTVSTRTASA